MTNCQYSIILFNYFNVINVVFDPDSSTRISYGKKIIYFLYVYDKIKSLLVSLFYNNNLISYLIV